MTTTPSTRRIGHDYWVAYYRGRSIDIFRSGKEWVAFAGGFGSPRFRGTTKNLALREAVNHISTEDANEVS